MDQERSTVRFRVRHFGLATVQGRFTSFSGQVGRAGAAGFVEVASVQTGQDIRDARLRSDEFFDAARYPRILFEADGPLADSITGRLTIRDLTGPLVLRLRWLEGEGGTPQLRVRGAISRGAFGLDWSALTEAGRLLVSDRVQLALDLVLKSR